MAFDAFLKIDGIPGESTDSKHADWIEIIQFSHRMEQPASVTASSTGGATAERVNHGTFDILHLVDKSSPKIYDACCTGRHIKEVTLELEVKNTFLMTDSIENNVIAEIPGTDPKLKNEVVMLGAHLDSWHAATGATDNGAGSGVMMEVMRILKALDIKPRRTIRLALWSGEEQGLLGSRGYVKNHFGDRMTMTLKPEQEKISAYYNLDNGGGKIRGIYMQGNDEVRPIFEAWLEPFHDLGATTVTIRNTGSTDHISFDEIGIPGFQFIQDGLEYGTRTHHTNMDSYEHLSGNDLAQASVIIASFVYHTAMRDEKMPRKALPTAAKP